MQMQPDISRSYGAASCGHSVLADWVASVGRGSHHKGAKLFYAARLVNGRAVFIFGLSRHQNQTLATSNESGVMQSFATTAMKEPATSTPDD